MKHTVEARISECGLLEADEPGVADFTGVRVELPGGQVVTLRGTMDEARQAAMMLNRKAPVQIVLALHLLPVAPPATPG